jgi:CheY-like chemotaxis protein
MSTELASDHRCSVLIVDDDAELREVLRVALATDGYAVSTAANGREALHHLRSTADTCIILLELHLPVMDAAAFRRVQQRDRSLAWIPIIVMSAGRDGESQARQLSARRFLRKPLDVDELRRALRQIGCCQATQRASSR